MRERITLIRFTCYLLLLNVDKFIGTLATAGAKLIIL